MSRRRRAVCLVVDASVARAASAVANPAGNGCGQACRQVLKTIWDGERLRLAFSPKLYAEWKEHEGILARKVRSSMMAAKRIDVLSSETNCHGNLETAAERAQHRGKLTEAGERAVKKDSHLVAVALKADRRIISLDAKVERFLRGLCDACVELKKLYWANPYDDRAARPDCVGWLTDGAPGRISLKLCH